MRLRALSLALLLPLAAPGLRAQSTRLGQSEILGRLALEYSPSYIAHLVKTRGLNFSPSEDFLYRVKLAGGDGILLDRLNSGDAVPSVVASADQDVSIRRLAKCAELIHTGAIENAESECRAAIEENVMSPWPLLAEASLLEPDRFSRPLTPPSDASKAARTELLKRAAALAPNLAVTQSKLGPLRKLTTAIAGKPFSVFDPESLDLTEAGDWPGKIRSFAPITSVPARRDDDDDKDDDDDEQGSEASITLPPSLERLMEFEPDLASSHEFVGVQYLRAGDFEKARKEFGEALRLEPDVPGPHFLMAVLDFSLHDEESGLAELRETVRIAPAGTYQHMGVARALEQMKRTPEAMGELRATVAMHPAAYEPSSALVELYLAHKDTRSAVAESRRFLDIASSAFTEQKKFVEYYSGELYQLVNSMVRERALDAAGEEYLFLLRYRPNDVVLRSEYGQILLDMRRVDEALEQFNEAARNNPQWPDVHANIGVCLSLKRNLEGAIEEFHQALELDPNDFRARVFLGSALSRSGQREGATEQFQKLISKDPQNPDVHMEIGYALETIHDEPAAIRELKQSLESKPDLPGAENDLAWLYLTADDLQLRDPVQALVLARRAVATSPEPDAAYLDTLAEALLVNGEPAEALAYEQQAAKLEPDNSDLRARLPRFEAAVQTQTALKR